MKPKPKSKTYKKSKREIDDSSSDEDIGILT